MGLVPDGDNVRMNAGEHLAAGGTCPGRAFDRRPDTPWPQQRTARAAIRSPLPENSSAWESVPRSGGFPDPPGNGVIDKFHWTASLLSRFPQKCRISIAYFTQKGKNRFSYQWSAEKIFNSILTTFLVNGIIHK